MNTISKVGLLIGVILLLSFYGSEMNAIALLLGAILVPVGVTVTLLEWLFLHDVND